MSNWVPIAVAVVILLAVVVREVLRWRGRRWRRSGPRGNDLPIDGTDSPSGTTGPSD